MDCIKGCRHLPITKELVEQAKKDNADMLKQKGINNPTAIILTQSNHIIGSIAQNGVFKYMDKLHIPYKPSKFFDENIHSDKNDFECKGYSFDVKGSSMTGFDFVPEDSRLLIMEDDKKKIVDFYVFVKLQKKPIPTIHIVGFIGYEDFWEKIGQPFHSSNIKRPCHFVFAKDLIPLNNCIILKPIEEYRAIQGSSLTVQDMIKIDMIVGN